MLEELTSSLESPPADARDRPSTPPASDPNVVAGQRLTTRESQILELLAQGVPVRRISEQLSCAQSTVRRRITSICAKTGSRNRAEAIRYYEERLAPSAAGGGESLAARRPRDGKPERRAREARAGRETHAERRAREAHVDRRRHEPEPDRRPRERDGDRRLQQAEAKATADVKAEAATATKASTGTATEPRPAEARPAKPAPATEPPPAEARPAEPARAAEAGSATEVRPATGDDRRPGVTHRYDGQQLARVELARALAERRRPPIPKRQPRPSALLRAPAPYRLAALAAVTAAFAVVFLTAVLTLTTGASLFGVIAAVAALH